MANRRELIKGAIALAAIAAMRPASSHGAASSRPAALGENMLVIADRSLPEAAAFGAAAAARGYGIRTFDTDAGALWMNVIELRLRAGAVAILGVTGAATLFCLETLARDYGASPVTRLATREVALDFANLLAADSADPLPPFAHVLAVSPSPTTLLWRIETRPRIRSIPELRG